VAELLLVVGVFRLLVGVVIVGSWDGWLSGLAYVNREYAIALKCKCCAL
ncbi:421_t:CDS:1, partial [Racocetra persica]